MKFWREKKKNVHNCVCVFFCFCFVFCFETVGQVTLNTTIFFSPYKYWKTGPKGIAINLTMILLTELPVFSVAELTL